MLSKQIQSRAQDVSSYLIEPVETVYSGNNPDIIHDAWWFAVGGVSRTAKYFHWNGSIFDSSSNSSIDECFTFTYLAITESNPNYRSIFVQESVRKYEIICPADGGARRVMQIIFGYQTLARSSSSLAVWCQLARAAYLQDYKAATRSINYLAATHSGETSVVQLFHSTKQTKSMRRRQLNLRFFEGANRRRNSANNQIPSLCRFVSIHHWLSDCPVHLYTQIVYYILWLGMWAEWGPIISHPRARSYHPNVEERIGRTFPFEIRNGLYDIWFQLKIRPEKLLIGRRWIDRSVSRRSSHSARWYDAAAIISKIVVPKRCAVIVIVDMVGEEDPPKRSSSIPPVTISIVNVNDQQREVCLFSCQATHARSNDIFVVVVMSLEKLKVIAANLIAVLFSEHRKWATAHSVWHLRKITAAN